MRAARRQMAVERMHQLVPARAVTRPRKDVKNLPRTQPARPHGYTGPAATTYCLSHKFVYGYLSAFSSAIIAVRVGKLFCDERTKYKRNGFEDLILL